MIVNAAGIKAGESGEGTVELHLASERTSDTMANPALRLISATIMATVGTNAQCNLTSINEVAVVQDP